VLIFGRNKDADCHEVRVVREAGISVLFSFCDHLRLASLPIEHYDARHIIGFASTLGKAKDICPWRFHWDLPTLRKPFSPTAIFLSRLLS
jgi:hypothetical protein